MAVATRRVKLKPAHAHGTCMWEEPLGAADPLTRRGVLAVYNGKAFRPHWQSYEVLEWSDLKGPIGYTLSYVERKSGEVRTYDLPADLTSCDCGSAVFQDGPCKHVQALAALLRIPVRGVEPSPIYSPEGAWSEDEGC